MEGETFEICLKRAVEDEQDNSTYPLLDGSEISFSWVSSVSTRNSFGTSSEDISKLITLELYPEGEDRIDGSELEIELTNLLDELESEFQDEEFCELGEEEVAQLQNHTINVLEEAAEKFTEGDLTKFVYVGDLLDVYYKQTTSCDIHELEIFTSEFSPSV